MMELFASIAAGSLFSFAMVLLIRQHFLKQSVRELQRQLSEFLDNAPPRDARGRFKRRD